MNILSIYGGVGSMIIGAKEQGFEILPNIEPRKAIDSKTFEHNFGQKVYRKLEEYSNDKEIDIIIGHPNCGKFSNISTKNIFNIELLNDDKFKNKILSDINYFIKGVLKYKPKLFVMENKTQLANVYMPVVENYNIEKYDILYKDYGNPQHSKKRSYYIGVKKGHEYAFEHIKDEYKKTNNVGDCILNIPKDAPNNYTISDDMKALNFKRYHITNKNDPVVNEPITVGELKKFIIRQEPYKSILVRNKGRRLSLRIGTMRILNAGKSPTLIGSNSIFNEEGRHLNTRERARLHGCPDNFKFFPDIGYNEKGYSKLAIQTGKFICVFFTTYLTNHIKENLK